VKNNQGVVFDCVLPFNLKPITTDYASRHINTRIRITTFVKCRVATNFHGKKFREKIPAAP